VVVDMDANELADKTVMAIDQPLAVDAGVFIHCLLADATPLNTADWRTLCADWKTRYTQNEGRVFPPSGPISHAHFIDALSDAAPKNTLIATGSSGLAVEFFYAGFRNKAGQRMFLTSGLGAMGYGLPAAIGACLGNGRHPMLAVESDGSLQLNLQELATLASLKLPICLFVMNNGGYASIRNTQRNYFDGRYLASGPSSGLTMPSLEKVADTYGLGFYADYRLCQPD
jgi:acetolactate synthase-1/2/3 large subunit